MEALKARMTSISPAVSQSPLAGAINYRSITGMGCRCSLTRARRGRHHTFERSMRPIAMKTEFIVQRQRGRRESWAILASLVNTAKSRTRSQPIFRWLSALSPGGTKAIGCTSCCLEWKAARARSLQAAA